MKSLYESILDVDFEDTISNTADIAVLRSNTVKIIQKQLFDWLVMNGLYDAQWLKKPMLHTHTERNKQIVYRQREIWNNGPWQKIGVYKCFANLIKYAKTLCNKHDFIRIIANPSQKDDLFFAISYKLPGDTLSRTILRINYEDPGIFVFQWNFNDDKIDHML